MDRNLSWCNVSDASYIVYMELNYTVCVAGTLTWTTVLWVGYVYGGGGVECVWVNVGEER